MSSVYTSNELVSVLPFKVAKLRTGRKEQFKASPLDDVERKNLEYFFTVTEEYLYEKSDLLYYIFIQHKDLIARFTEVVKGAFNGPTFGGIEPDQGEFGIQLIFPQLLKYSADVPVAWANNSWNITVGDTEVGNTKYLMGSATDYFRGNATTGSRTHYLIFRDGLISVGDKPFFNQYNMEFEGKPYNIAKMTPFNDFRTRRYRYGDGYVDITDELLYPAEFPYVIYIPHDYGYKLTVMPERSGTFELRVFGVVWYEYDAFKDFKWIA